MLKKLTKCLREYKPITVLTMIMMVIEAAMEVLIPLLIFRFGKCVQPTGGGDPDTNGMILYGCRFGRGSRFAYRGYARR